MFCIVDLSNSKCILVFNTELIDTNVFVIYVDTSAFKDAQALCFKKNSNSGEILNSLCHNFNVDIKTYAIVSSLNRILDTRNWLQTIAWYKREARLMTHRIAFSDFRNTS